MLAKLKQELKNFYPYAKKRLGFERPVRLFLRQDANNAADVYGKTAYYDPQEEKVVLYVTDRHPKDILRSFAHELVHHKQNCEGRLSGLTAGEGYAQTNLGDKLEKEAYVGSKLVRDFEDTHLCEQQTENLRRNQMTTEELKQKVESIVKEYLDEKKAMPDKNKDGVPDYAQDGEGANDLGKGKTEPKKKKGGKVPPQLEPFVKGKKENDKDEDEDKEEKKVNENKTPQPKPEQTNDDWYWNSLYSKLKDKWTK